MNLDTSARTWERWTIQRAQAWQDEHGWISGCNFPSLPSASNIRSLDLARQSGFNSIRVCLGHSDWQRGSGAFLQRFEEVVEAAHFRGLSVLPVFFSDDDAGLPTSTWPSLRAYLQEFVQRWGQDTRVAGWDLYHAPGTSVTDDNALELLQSSFGWARQIQPAQPVTSGLWAHHTPRCNRWMLEHSDVLSFRATPDTLHSSLHKYLSLGRPSVCTSLPQDPESTSQLGSWQEAGVGYYIALSKNYERDF